MFFKSKERDCQLEGARKQKEGGKEVFSNKCFKFKVTLVKIVKFSIFNN